MSERLTTRLANGGVGYDSGEYFKVCYPWNENCLSDIDRMAIRLCDLEDKIQQGKFVELPCKLGDTVYCVWQYSDFTKTEPPFIKEETVCSFIIDEGVAKIIPKNYGEMVDNWHRLMAVAFTKEEAEKALAERSEE